MDRVSLQPPMPRGVAQTCPGGNKEEAEPLLLSPRHSSVSVSKPRQAPLLLREAVDDALLDGNGCHLPPSKLAADAFRTRPAEELSVEAGDAGHLRDR